MFTNQSKIISLKCCFFKQFNEIFIIHESVQVCRRNNESDWKYKIVGIIVYVFVLYPGATVQIEWSFGNKLFKPKNKKIKKKKKKAKNRN